MKIDDSRPVEKILVPLFVVLLISSTTIRCIQDRRVDTEVVFILLFFILLIGVLAYLTSITVRHYWVDQDGIKVVMRKGKRKIQFKWSDFNSLCLYTASYARAEPRQTVLVLSTLRDEELPNKGAVKNISWFEFRYKSIIAIKFSVERYEFIRQFCDLPLIDNR